METSPNDTFSAMYPQIPAKSTFYQQQNSSVAGQQRRYPTNNFIEQQSVTNGENHQQFPQFQSQQNSTSQPFMGQMMQQLPPQSMPNAYAGQQVQQMQQPLRPPSTQQIQQNQGTGQRYPQEMSAPATSGQNLPPPPTQNYGQYRTQPQPHGVQNYTQQFPQQASQQNYGLQETQAAQNIQNMPNMGQQYPPQSQPPYGAPPQMPSKTMQHRYPGQQLPPPPQQQQPLPSQPQQMQQQYYGSGGIGAPQGYPPHASQVQQQQRLDPDAMPSVVQVIEDDKAKFDCDGNLMYTTTVPASVPPMVTTLAASDSVIVDDHGCARPNHVRSTIWQVPVTEDLLKMTCIPLSVIVKPFDENEIDGNLMIPVTQSEILRCNRCKAYMNPFMRFIDGGRRFQCCLCHHISEVPASYAGHLDHTGQRLDKFERPELYLGSYEFKATAEFCRNSILNCRRPHIVFAFELTVNSRPVIQYISKHLSDVVRNYLPTDPANPGSPPPLIGFMTYNSKIQMYDIVNNGHAYIICDVTSTFPPFTSFLVDPLEYGDQIESFLSSLPSLVPDDELETETILGPVIEAALKTCQFDNSNWFTEQVGSDVQRDPTQVIPGGKVYLFHCTLPTYGQDGVTPGRLKPRWTTSADDARQLLRTEKEKQLLMPESGKYYSELAQRCVTDYGSGVELFLFPPAHGSYLDIATISELVRLTGTGGIYTYYASSNWDVSGRFINDLKFSIKSSFAFDSIMKVRTSTGIRAVEYSGNFYARTTSDIECGSLNAGNSIVVELRYDDKLPEDEWLIIQVATLYTSVSGDRRVRIHNLALQVCQQVADIFRNACCDSVMNSLLRKGVSQLRLGEKTVQQIKESLITRTVSILASYRRHCAQPGSSLGQLILPEALKLLPMYVTGALKCDAIDGGQDLTIDAKAFAQIVTLGAGIGMTQVILYPRLLRLEYDKESSDMLNAVQIRCAAHRLDNESGVAYLLENGFHMFLYIPTSNISSNQQLFLRNVFGVESVQQINVEAELPDLYTSECRFVKDLVTNINKERNRYSKLNVVRQGMDKMELLFKTLLYEDKKSTAPAGVSDSAKYEAPTYVDLLCHLHKEIRAQLN